METHVDSDSEASVASLLGGIVQDARRLLVEQLKLFQVEIKNDMRRTLTALVPLGTGAVTCLAAFILLGMGLSFLLSWAMPALPVWAAFVIVGVIVAAIGAGLVFWGINQLKTVSPVPDAAISELKENIAALTERKENNQWKANK